MDFLVALFFFFGLSCYIFGLQTLIFIPLSLLFELKQRRKRPAVFKDPLVSVIVPAYNEEKVIANCVRSILDSDYPNFEVILVNDGSTDRTLEIMLQFAAHPRVRILTKENGGKASALNAGIEAARGDILFFIDGDTYFRRDTIRRMIDAFDSENVGAVCGHDTPVNLNNLQLKLFNLQSHVTTGFVRRALSVINCLPIVSGNIGAYRRDVLEKIGFFRDGFIGEDLELTFRVHRAGYRVAFQPVAQVYAESPSTFQGFWKQRVRWARGFLQTIRLHKDMIFNAKRFGAFGLYIGINALNMVLIPLLQLASFALLFVLLTSGFPPISITWMGIVSYTGLTMTVLLSAYSILLDRRPEDLRHLPLALLWIPYSLIIDMIMLRAIYLELKGAEASWNKVERTGVISKRELLFAWWHSTRKQWAAGRTVPAYAAGFLAVLVFFGATFVDRPTYTAIHEGDWIKPQTYVQMVKQPLPAGGVRAIAVHFDQYENWQDAYRTALKAKEFVNTVGIGAGRADWTYFRWRSHPEWWANALRTEGKDFLAEAAERLKAAGKTVVAIVDQFAPRYIQKHPEAAARNFHGEPSHQEVCLTELVDGDFGRLMLDMIEELVARYPIDAINLTELSYETFCYDDRCLESFRQFSGKAKWPTRWLRGGVDIDHPEVVEWRNRMVSRWVKKVAEVVHRHGKELYVDVEVSWDDYRRNSREHGQDYALLLQHADKLVIWDYFNLERIPPEKSYGLAKYLRKTFGEHRIILSIGLWDSWRPVLPADQLGRALAASANGGIRNFWITPSHMMRKSHWQVLEAFFRNTAVDSDSAE